MSARETVRDYYEALRRGEPLYPYFVEREDVVKVAISERLVGYEAIAEALRDQTRTTEDWTVESTDLRVTRRGDVAWFDDAVRMAWTLSRQGERVDHETRWSGVIERHPLDGNGEAGGGGEAGGSDDAGGGDGGTGGGDDGAGGGDDGTGGGDAADSVWLFAAMHVSTASDVVE